MATCTIDVTRVLRESAFGDDFWAPIVLYDELPYRKDLTPSQLDQVQEASRWRIDNDPEAFYFACARILIRNRPNASEIPLLLHQLLRLRRGISTMELVCEYFESCSWKIDHHLALQFAAAFHQMGIVKKAALLIDRRVRQMLRLAKSEDQ